MVVAIRCPVCGDPLAEAPQRWSCARGHSFDRARQGYVNLYRPGRARPPQAGDSDAMLRARRAVLDSGVYRPVAAAVAAAAATALAGLARACIVDAGCGEAYYTQSVVARCADAHVDLIAFDLAKTAVRLAASRLPGGRLFVADIWQPWLLPDGCADLLLNLFAPRNPAEMARVLRPGGTLLTLIPAPAHLAALRRAYGLLAIETDKRARVRDALGAAGLRLTAEAQVTHSTPLPSPLADQLAAMLPGAARRVTPATPVAQAHLDVHLLRFTRT